jgi:hypothetical protein
VVLEVLREAPLSPRSLVGLGALIWSLPGILARPRIRGIISP